VCGEFEGLKTSTNSSVGPLGPFSLKRLITNGLVLLKAASAVHCTATLKEQVAVLLASSVAVQVTVVVPVGKLEPDAGVQSTVTPGQLSEATGFGYSMIVPGSFGSVITEMFSGHVTAGGCVSLTVTVNEQLGPVVEVHVTVVVPTGKKEPEAGEQVTVPHAPEVVGAG